MLAPGRWRARHESQVFQPDEPDVRHARDSGTQLGLFNKHARGEDGAHLRHAAGSQHRVRPGGVVQHRRHTPERLQREHGDDCAIGVGQHDAQPLARGRLRRQRPAQHGRAQDEALEGKGLERHVLQHFGGRAMQGGGVQECREQAAVCGAGAELRVDHQVFDGGAQGQPPGAAR